MPGEDFKGVLVTDFYSGYNDLARPHQRGSGAFAARYTRVKPSLHSTEPRSHSIKSFTPTLNSYVST